MGNGLNAAVVRHLWQVLQRAVVLFRRHDVGVRAAALAYYSLLSLFPLLLLMISLFSRWLSTATAVDVVFQAAAQVIPVLPPEFNRTLRQVLAVRGPVNAVAGITLLWSASSLFNALTSALDRIWSGDRGRAFWEHRLLSLGLVLGVVVLFFLSSLLGLALSLIPRLVTLLVPIRAELFWWGWQFVPPLVSLTVDVVLYALLYRFIPSRTAPWPAVWAGALVAGLGWNAVKVGFGWYLTRFARYGLVYGTLASLVAFLIWVYLSGFVLLLGAVLGAAWHAEAEAGETQPTHVV